MKYVVHLVAVGNRPGLVTSCNKCEESKDDTCYENAIPASEVWRYAAQTLRWLCKREAASRVVIPISQPPIPFRGAPRACGDSTHVHSSSLPVPSHVL